VKARRIILLTCRTLAALIVLLIILAVWTGVDYAIDSAGTKEDDAFGLFLLALVSLPLLFLWAVLTIAQTELDRRSSAASGKSEPRHRGPLP
jgi:hypothetical protein